MARAPVRPRIRLRPATVVLALVLVAVYALEVAASGHVVKIPSFSLARLGGNEPEVTRGLSEWHRLVTAGLLHAGLVHIVMNLSALVVIGPALEEAVGAGWLTASFVLSVVTGNVVSAVGNRPDAVAIGASGGIFGLIALAAALAFLAPSRFRFDRNHLVQWILFGLVLGVVAGFDNWGHIGGVLGGGIVGYVVVSIEKPAPLRRAGAVMGLVAVALAGVCVARAETAYAHPRVIYDDRYNDDVGRVSDALNRNDVAAASAAGDVLAARHPEDPQAQYFAGLAAMRADRYAEALPRLQRALAPMDATTAEASRLFVEKNADPMRERLAECLLKLGRRDEAKAAAAPLCARPDLRWVPRELCSDEATPAADVEHPSP